MNAKLLGSILGMLLLLGSLLGCSRDHYRLRADADAYGRILEKSQCKPWAVPGNFSVYPPSHSRLYDPSCVNDPCLPTPAPQLYEYELPELPPREDSRFQPQHQRDESRRGETQRDASPTVDELMPEPSLDESPTDADDDREQPPELLPPAIEPSTQIDAASGQQHPEVFTNPFAPTVLASAIEDEGRTFQALLRSEGDDVLGLGDELPGEGSVDDGSADDEKTDSNLDENVLGDEVEGAGDTKNTDDAENGDDSDESDDAESEVQARLVPLPRSYWESIPPECLSRMLAFKSVRDEYARTYGSGPKRELLDNSPKLALEDIIDLTLLNSRELQTRKELLYRTALALTLQRFEYQLRPSVGGNGSDLLYDHNRSGGVTVNTLGIPTSLQLERMTYAGADVIGRFANSILLTFNGPQGFQTNVSSVLFFNFSQSLLQRDIRLENLTQAERDVVYAARDFARFRKQLFVAQATDYYSLIRQFRQIEIQCQNYFTLAREFNQRSVEIKYGMAARTQLDQVEQQVINGRQSILSSCTNLENALDSLKVQMGLPTEQPLNLDLSELNLLTLRDELAVNAELIERTRLRINREIRSDTRSAFVIIGGVAQLAEQLIDSLRLRKQLGEQSVDADPLNNRLLDLRIEAADIDVAEDVAILNLELDDEAPDSTKVIQRRRDVSQELTRKIMWQIRRLEQDPANESKIPDWVSEYENLEQRLTDLENKFIDMIFREQSSVSSEDADDFRDAEQELIEEVSSLQSALESLAKQLDGKLGRTAPTDESSFERRAIEFAQELIVESERLRDQGSGGLVPIEIEMDEAMMTALVQRFDLMNQRGFLADDWRRIKYAGDDLRSILNLNASQSIRTRPGQNKPFDFTFDESTTSLGLSFDLPLNRRAQRNNFRVSIFNYQRTLRDVMQLEDGIKLDVRRDLRSLKLNGQQYDNDVAGAALASERVTGTELEVRGGFATSRDFLESQQAYVQAISGVASDHINYIVGRLQLFLDLESLTLGENGFWDELYDEQYQPEPVFQIPGYARPAYGCLHPKLKYSKQIQRMRCVPNGVSMIHDPERNIGDRYDQLDPSEEEDLGSAEGFEQRESALEGMMEIQENDVR